MSLYKDASLVMIPSAYKDGKLYSIRPTDGDGDFTFSRGSNLAATRVDVNGLIEKGRENLVLHSNSFDNAAWSKLNGASISSTQVADPFGGTNAWQLTFATNNDSRIQQQVTTSSGAVYAFSVWARVTSGTKNVSIGAIGNLVPITLTTTWQRFESFAVETDTNGFPQIRKNNSEGEYTIEIYGFQLEKGLVATDYIETGASTAQAGILEDMPRLDYSGSCPALLLEPQRSNSIISSEHIDSWSKNEFSVDTNSATSPEGVVNASKIIPSTNNTGHYIDRLGFSRTANQYIAHSVYVKPNGYNYFSLSNAANRLIANFELIGEGSARYVSSNGTDFTNHSASIEAVGNGWYRCILIGQALNSVATYMRISCGSSAYNSSAWNGAGDGTSGVLVYGAQVELNSSYPTSYIPTYGTSQTRSQENHQLNITSIITSSNFTWFFDLGDWVGSVTNGGTYELINTGSTRIQLRVRSDGYRMYYQNTNGGSAYPVAGSKTANKFCVAYDGLNYRLFIDGTLVNTYSSIGDTNWSFLMNTGGNGVYETLIIKQEVLFATALTDSECIALTTL